MRLMDARLHAVSSRNTNSEHGFVALMRSVLLQVCQRWMVSSNWTPGSAHCHAASEILRHSSAAAWVWYTSPVVRSVVLQVPPEPSASMNRSGTRTELFEFWPETVAYASPLKSDEKPACTSAATLRSSRTFHWMKSMISGWSRSSTTILAARRVVPPDLVAPAPRSSTSRNDMRPEEVPPPDSFSMRPRSFEKLLPVPEPNLKTRASLRASSKMDMRSSPTDWMKQAETWGRE